MTPDNWLFFLMIGLFVVTGYLIVKAPEYRHDDDPDFP